MSTVKIYTKCLSENEKEELLLLLQEAGYEVIAPEDDNANLEIGIAPDQDGDGDSTEEVLIVLMNAACEIDIELKKVAMAAVRMGGRVIGVWPKGATEGKVPLPLERHGSTTVTWNPKKLREAVEESSAQWETTAGAARDEPSTKRNRC